MIPFEILIFFSRKYKMHSESKMVMEMEMKEAKYERRHPIAIGPKSIGISVNFLPKNVHYQST